MVARWLDRVFPARGMLYDMGRLEARQFQDEVHAYLDRHRYGAKEKWVYATLADVLADYFQRCPSRHEDWHRSFVRGVIDELEVSLKRNYGVRLELHPPLLAGGKVPHERVPVALTYVGVNFKLLVKPHEDVISLEQARLRKKTLREPAWGHRF